LLRERNRKGFSFAGGNYEKKRKGAVRNSILERERTEGAVSLGTGKGGEA